MSKEQGLHNEEACNALIGLTGFNDWVVTTAFYSALHFVDHAMFPRKYKNKLYRHFGEFSRDENYQNLSRHEFRCDIVWQFFPSIGPDFEWLFNQCMIARYRDYHVSIKDATEARESLSRIKDLCVPANP